MNLHIYCAVFIQKCVHVCAQTCVFMVTVPGSGTEIMGHSVTSCLKAKYGAKTIYPGSFFFFKVIK